MCLKKTTLEPSKDERTLVEEVFKDVKTGAKYAFTSADGNELVVVPFKRAEKANETKAFHYRFSDIANKWTKMSRSKNALLSDILKGLQSQGTLFNPQFLQGVGLFHGSHFCQFGPHSTTPSSCTSVFTDPSWAFLKKFDAGPAELDLVFDGGYGHAYFFKGDEFIAYDLQKKAMVDGYPKKVSTFLAYFGLKGNSFAALS